MKEHHEIYRGHEIAVAPPPGEPAAERTADQEEAELRIDDEPVFTLRNSAGMYVAAGFAYAPHGSLVDLARRIIDFRKRTEEGGSGPP